MLFHSLSPKPIRRRDVPSAKIFPVVSFKYTFVSVRTPLLSPPRTVSPIPGGDISPSPVTLYCNYFHSR